MPSIEEKVEFTLQKEHRYKNKIFQFELISPILILSFLTTAVSFVNFGAVLIGFLGFTALVLTFPYKSRMLSNIPFIFSHFNIIAHFFLKRYLKKHLDINFEEYLKKSNKNEIFYFFDDLNDIDNKNYKEALLYWAEINKRAKELNVKEYATDKIQQISRHIEEYNRRVSDYEEKQSKINEILQKEKLTINNKKEEKLKILSI